MITSARHLPSGETSGEEIRGWLAATTVAIMSGVIDGSGVSVGAEVRVKVGFGVRVRDGVGDGCSVAVGAAVVAGDVGVCAEVAHAVNSSRLAQMPKIIGNRMLFMPPVYNGFHQGLSTLA